MIVQVSPVLQAGVPTAHCHVIQEYVGLRGAPDTELAPEQLETSALVRSPMDHQHGFARVELIEQALVDGGQ